MRVNGSKHTQYKNELYVWERAFIEVTGDDSDIVIFSLDQTQFIVQHANKRSYKKDRGWEQTITNIKSIFLLATKSSLEQKWIE